MLAHICTYYTLRQSGTFLLVEASMVGLHRVLGQLRLYRMILFTDKKEQSNNPLPPKLDYKDMFTEGLMAY